MSDAESAGPEDHIEYLRSLAQVLIERSQTQDETPEENWERKLKDADLLVKRRSFVTPGANTTLPILICQTKGNAWDEHIWEVRSLWVVDQNGMRVPATDLYQYLRQHVCEICTRCDLIINHYGENDLWIVYESDTWEKTLQKWTQWRMPWPLQRLFDNFKFDHALKLIESHRQRKLEAQLVLKAYERHTHADGPFALIKEFIGTTILSRDDVRTVMNDLVAAYHDEDHDHIWNAEVNETSGGFWDKFYGVRWKVYRKGEDPKFSDESSGDEASEASSVGY